MERSPSPPPSIDGSDDTPGDHANMTSSPEDRVFKPDISSAKAPKTPTKKNKTTTAAATAATKVTPLKSPKKPKVEHADVKINSAGGSSPGKATSPWDGEKKALFMDEIIAVGYKAADLDQLAAKLGLSKRQLIDQLVPNRSNLRSKAVRGARGE
ncbi:hypothetical protein IAU59_004216 [Kwoniella sp. CBS 9459]